MDKVVAPTIEAEVTLRASQDGGRRSPLELDHPQAFYRPHLVIGDPNQRQAVVDSSGTGTEEYLGVQFRRTNFRLGPGQSANVRMDLMFYPACSYEHVQPGATFTIREGRQIVGYGRVLRRSDENAI